MSSSGHGQSLVRAEAGIDAAWDCAQTGGRAGAGRVIVEGFIDFDYEITLLTVRHAGGTAFCEPIGHWQKDGDYRESWQPQPMSPRARERAQQIARAVTDDLGGWGLFGVELFVKGDSVWFSEVSPRPHDTGMVTMATQWQNEFELHARAILGLPVDTTLKSPGASAVIYGGVDAKGIVFDGVAEALAVRCAVIAESIEALAVRAARIAESMDAVAAFAWRTAADRLAVIDNAPGAVILADRLAVAVAETCTAPDILAVAVCPARTAADSDAVAAAASRTAADRLAVALCPALTAADRDAVALRGA